MSAGPDPAMNGAPSVMRPGTLEGAMSAALDAVEQLARKASGADNPAEAQKLMSGALAGAQAFAVLDPNRLVGGDTPEARRDSVPEPSGTKDADRDGRIGEK